MPTSKIDVPFGSWVEILPASGTAFCTVNSPWPVRFVRAGAAPGDPLLPGTQANQGDVIPASSAEPTFAIAPGGPNPTGNDSIIIAHTE